MNNTTTTFLSFIQKHSIQIPLIQRDYVQGLALDDKMREKRDEFIKKLFDALLPEHQPYTLDFIYGARESFDDKTTNPNAPFLPLDGQQRLTTLYLLHWILAIRTNNHDVLKLLRKFSYKTRISSDKFCRRLLSSSFLTSESLFCQIENKTWYICLKTDPTVKALMEMINQMELTLATEPYKTEVNEMARLLFDGEEQRLTFSILDMERYHLTDGLYVKMNARGKELTAFENWKADFINLISRNEETKYKFTQSIEHKWNDLFWKGVYRNYIEDINQASTERDKHIVKYPRIDEHFMNFFTNYSRLFFFVATQSNDPKVEDYNGKVWSTTESLYGQNDRLVIELFETLDALVGIDTNMGLDRFFNELFYTTPSTQWDDYTTRVKLFNIKNVNLFKTCYENDTFGMQHVLLYAVLKYCIKYKISNVSDELKAYTRFSRNYLYQHCYLDSGAVNVAPNIRVVDMKKYDKVFEYLCSEQNVIDSIRKPFNGEESIYIEYERDKNSYYEKPDVLKLEQKIEDTSFCYGDIQGFKSVLEKCKNGEWPCEKVWEAIYAFLNASNLQKAQLFVSFDYKGVEIGNDCAYGKRIFIGAKDKWGVHFRIRNKKDEKAISRWALKYVEAYLNTPDIAKIIAVEQKKIEHNPKSMRDYMLKYKQVIAAQVRWRKNIEEAPFYYAMPKPWDNMDSIVIHSFSNRPLGNAYQTCPMVNAVARSMSNYDEHHMSYEGQGSDKRGIRIYDGEWNKIYFSMRFAENEWHIELEHCELPNELQRRLEPVVEDDGIIYYYRLSPKSGYDLVENGRDFIERVVDYLKAEKII